MSSQQSLRLIGKGGKLIYDELHGYVELNEVERRVIDTPTFQRLRFIRQLAAAWYVYPGATHTRFSHSIGTMYVMGVLATTLAKEGWIKEDDIELLKLAALLHDVGHMPFSHAVESVYASTPERINHSKLSAEVVVGDPDIKEVIKSAGYDPHEVASLILGTYKEPLYNQLLSSDLDSDRIDYLLRDAHHTGVAYGLIDASRILATLTIDKDGNLAVQEKGVQAIENFYIARMHMYQSVYYHKTIVGYELLLSIIYRRLVDELPELKDFKNPAYLRTLIRKEKLRYWHDGWLVGKMINAMDSKDVEDLTKQLIDMFLSRRGYKVIIDLSRLSNSPLSTDDESVRTLYEIEEMLEDQGYGNPKATIFIDDISIVNKDEAVRVVFKDGRSEPIWRIETSIISMIPTNYHVKRLYAIPLIVNKVKDLANYILKKRSRKWERYT
mgnify:CR=1 FL=1